MARGPAPPDAHAKPGPPAWVCGPAPAEHGSLDRFEVLAGNNAGRSLGSGTFGVIERVRHKSTGEVYALKMMSKLDVIEGGQTDAVEQEIYAQRSLKHPNVLRLFEHFEDVDTVYLLLEYCAKGDLYHQLRTCTDRHFSEEVGRDYFGQVTRGLAYVHSQRIVHRDLKPENLFVTHDGVLKIADFGSCADSSVTRVTFCGTLDYLAPEMIEHRGHDQTLDIWGLGILLYEMIVGQPAFRSTNPVVVIEKILDIDLRFPAFVPHGVRDLIPRLLQREPADRMPLEQVMRHLWVTGDKGKDAAAASAMCRPGRDPSPPSHPTAAAASHSETEELRPEPAAVAQQQQPRQSPLQTSRRDVGSGGTDATGRPGIGDRKIHLQQQPQVAVSTSRGASPLASSRTVVLKWTSPPNTRLLSPPRRGQQMPRVSCLSPAPSTSCLSSAPSPRTPEESQRPHYRAVSPGPAVVRTAREAGIAACNPLFSPGATTRASAAYWLQQRQRQPLRKEHTEPLPRRQALMIKERTEPLPTCPERRRSIRDRSSGSAGRATAAAPTTFKIGVPQTARRYQLLPDGTAAGLAKAPRCVLAPEPSGYQRPTPPGLRNHAEARPCLRGPPVVLVKY